MPEIVGTLRPPRLSTPPPSPARGELYYDVDDDKLYWWNGSSWVQAGAASGTATVYDTDQIGTIKAYSGATIPANWMLADGRSLLRADYPQLFAALGGTGSPWGLSDGTHFEIPDLRQRFILGANSVATQNTPGGASTVTLTTAQMPSHAHTGATATNGGTLPAFYTGAADRSLAHGHNISIGNTGAGYGMQSGSTFYAQSVLLKNTDGNLEATIDGGAPDHLHYVPAQGLSIPAHGIYAEGGGGSHENMPPYIQVAQLIKVTGVTVDTGGALVGATGAKGDPGPWRGTWSAATSYAVGESVSYFDGSVTGSYRRKVAGTTAGTPKADTTNWEVIASGGSIGADGAVAVYEQATQPASTATGAIWIDTDDVPPAWTSLIPFVTVLPTNPVDGQEIYFQSAAMASEGIVWHLRYRSASSSAYKWEFIGGSPLYNLQPANENLGNSGYVALGTAGPIIALPLAGDYDIEHGFFMNNTVNGVTGWMSYDIGATGAVDGDASSLYCNTFANDTGYAIRNRRKTGLTVVTLTAKYRANGSFWFADRWMRARPVRVG